ncbi:MAG: hypothetical protein IKB02_05435 [Clostridia bacterium]|nr:hypothetical protein [Clostridia bacterium]
MSVKGNAKSYVELRGSLSLPEAIHGKSAYELAVMHGFEGTEAEWVRYLRYAKDGLTPYIGVNGHWWIGTQDTGVHAEGKDGVNGLTPYIGENGDWWIGEADTGVIAGTPKYMCGTGLMYEVETSLAPNKVYFLLEGDDDIPLTYLSAVASGTEDIEIGGTALEVGTVYFKYEEANDEPTTVTFTIDNSPCTVPNGTTWQDLYDEYSNLSGDDNNNPFFSDWYVVVNYVCSQMDDGILVKDGIYITLDMVIEAGNYVNSGVMPSDLETPGTIEFTIDNTSYTVAEGTTWGEWVDTTNGNYEVEGSLVMNMHTECYVSFTYEDGSPSEYVSANEVITSGTYTHA